MEKSVGRTAFSFRARLVVVMTALLLGTLGLIQYLNQRAQTEVQRALEIQKASLNDAFFAHLHDIRQATDVALASFNKTEYLYILLERPEYAHALNRDRIKHILVVEDDGLIRDSTDRALLKEHVPVPPVPADDSDASVGTVEQGDPVQGLLGEDGDDGDYETYWSRLETKQSDTGEKKFLWMAIVVSNKEVSSSVDRLQRDLADTIESSAATRLRLTLGVFALAVVVAMLLVWRFTRPITQLSAAAERVASGDLDFTVNIRRRDEVGHLATTFNGMIDGLRAKARLEERLNNAERAAVIGRLTSAIAHEIRNPLNFINLSIDHARGKYAPEDPVERDRYDNLLGSIKEETARLNRLVTDVLNFGRPANLHVRDFDLRSVVEKVVAMVRAQAEQQGVSVDVALPDTPAEVSADQEKLTSCFSNIAINAIQAMPTGGRFSVTLDMDEDGYRLRFGDTGTGISAAALDRIFEPYYSTKDTGTGLGLAVAKKIVDEHGGSIRVESTPGEGTTFEISVPRVSAEAQLAVKGA